MKRLLLLLLAISSCSPAILAQQLAKKPKLVVGIIVDQMRQEYFYRFADRYVEGGFRRFTHQGYMMSNGITITFRPIPGQDTLRCIREPPQPPTALLPTIGMCLP